jgi:hypothetical protein
MRYPSHGPTGVTIPDDMQIEYPSVDIPEKIKFFSGKQVNGGAPGPARRYKAGMMQFW